MPPPSQSLIGSIRGGGVIIYLSGTVFEAEGRSHAKGPHAEAVNPRGAALSTKRPLKSPNQEPVRDSLGYLIPSFPEKDQ